MLEHSTRLRFTWIVRRPQSAAQLSINPNKEQIMDFLGSNKSSKSKIDKALEDAQNPKKKKPKPKPKNPLTPPPSLNK